MLHYITENKKEMRKVISEQRPIKTFWFSEAVKFIFQWLLHMRKL